MTRLPGSQRAHSSTLKACKDLLELHGIPATRVGQTASFHRDGTYYSGTDKGCWDLHATLPPHGATCWIEVKSGNGQLTSEQRAFKVAQERAGAWCVVARSVDDLAEVVRAVKALERAVTG